MILCAASFFTEQRKSYGRTAMGCLHITAQAECYPLTGVMDENLKLYEYSYIIKLKEHLNHKK